MDPQYQKNGSAFQDLGPTGNVATDRNYGTLLGSNTTTVFLPIEDQSNERVSERKKAKGMAVLIQNVVMGASDGSTVPFALAAGLSGTVSSSGVVIVAVVAELAAGCIAMGLGGYMAAQAEADCYKNEKVAMFEHLVENPEEVVERLRGILQPIGVPSDAIESVFNHLRKNPNACAEFLVRHELGTEEPDQSQPLKSAFIVGLSYIISGSIPLVPYFLISNAKDALNISVYVAVLALFAFGWTKGALLGVDRTLSALQTTFLGALAAMASYYFAGIFND